mgnify:FL=1
MKEVKQLTIRVEMSLYDEVQKLAVSESRSVSQEIEYIIKKYLEVRK